MDINTLKAYVPESIPARRERNKRIQTELPRREAIKYTSYSSYGPRSSGQNNASKFRSIGAAGKSSKKIEAALRIQRAFRKFKQGTVGKEEKTLNNNGLVSHPLEPNIPKTRGFAKTREKTPVVNVNLGSFFEAAESNANKTRANQSARNNVQKNLAAVTSTYNNAVTKAIQKQKEENAAKAIKASENAAKAIKASENAAAKAKEASEKAAANAAANANKAKREASEKAAANAAANAIEAKKKANEAKVSARNALNKYLATHVMSKYNKSVVNASLRLTSPKMYTNQKGMGTLGGAAATTETPSSGHGAAPVSTNGARGAASAAPASTNGARGAGGFFSSLFARKQAGSSCPPSFIPFKKGMKIPFGYVLKTNIVNGKPTTGYFLNTEREYGPAPKPTGKTTGVSVGVGPSRYGNRYGNRYGYGNNYGNGRGGSSSGIVFKPQITVGAARIGAQTFGGTRVGGQQMGGSRAATGNVGGTTVKTGNTGGARVNGGNGRGLAVSAPLPSGVRKLNTTSEQLIREAGGNEAIEKGINALRSANGNIAKAKAMTRLPNKTFTNIYAMGGPVAAKKLVEQRRRRRRHGPGARKKRVSHKPRKQYIRLTPYQFKRLTDHIKKNNLRKVLIKEITH
jgi:hypothetical protein